MSNTTDDRPSDPAPPTAPAHNLAQDLVAMPRRVLRVVRKLGLREEVARRLVDGVLASLGLGPDRSPPPAATPADTGTVLAQERTDLAVERTYWAAERTLMAWIRTALSMISFGFTIGKLGEAIGDIEVPGLRGMRMVGTGTIAYFLVFLGTAALLVAAVQYSLRVQELCERGLRRQPSVEFVVALLLVVLGICAFGSLALKF